MPGYYIRNHSAFDNRIEVMVSKWSNKSESDAWFPIPKTLDDPSKFERWVRYDWEVVVFKCPETGRRRGWYLDPAGGFLELTFYGFQYDLGIAKRVEA